MENYASYLVAAQKMEIRKVPMPVIGSDEVGIKVREVCVCGSDIHFFEKGGGEIFKTALPFILGHEAAGEVYAVGDKVTHLAVGDRVAIEPGVPCGKCEYCMSGRYNLCKSVAFLAVPPYEGALRNYISHPAKMCFKLPDSMSTMEGALIEPLSVGLHATERGGVKLGSEIAILGGGAIGMCTLLAAKARGASRIIVVDLFESHLKKALALGATDVVNAREGDAVEAVMRLTGGDGVDVVFETAGSAVTLAQTGFVIKYGGTVVVVGNVMQEVPYSFRNIYRKEAQVYGVFRYRNNYPEAIRAVSSGRINIRDIVTNEFDFEHAGDAFATAAFDKTNCLKAVVHL